MNENYLTISIIFPYKQRSVLLVGYIKMHKVQFIYVHFHNVLILPCINVVLNILKI